MSASATPATTLLIRRGIDFTTHTYEHDARAGSFGDEAVAALSTDLDIDPRQVFKTLVLRTKVGSLVVAVLPVPESLSLKAAASALGVGKVAMAERAPAERSTGYVFGGISPVGQRTPLPTVVDATALHWDRVLCSGGRRGLEIALDPRDLVAITGAVVADVLA